MRGFGDNRLLKSPHLRVRWAGFESTAAQLQRFGWQFSVAERDFGGAFEVAMRHPEAGMVAYGTVDQPDLLRAVSRGLEFMGAPICCTLRMIADAHSARFVINAPLSEFNPADMEPQLMSFVDSASYAEFARIFAPAHVPEERQIIVDPNEVGSLMARILELQKPVQADIRERKRKAEARDSVRQVHAQILSFAA